MSLVEKAKRLLNDVQVQHQNLFMFLSEVRRLVQVRSLPEGNACDIGWLVKEMEGLLSDSRKEAARTKELIGRVLTLDITRRLTENPNASEKAVGDLSYGIPDLRQMPSFPDPGTPGYSALCEHFGVPKELEQSGVIKFRFNELVDYVTKRAQEGKPLPPGIDRTIPMYKMTFFKKRLKDRKKEVQVKAD